MHRHTGLLEVLEWNTYGQEKCARQGLSSQGVHPPPLQPKQRGVFTSHSPCIAEKTPVCGRQVPGTVVTSMSVCTAQLDGVPTQPSSHTTCKVPKGWDLDLFSSVQSCDWVFLPSTILTPGTMARSSLGTWPLWAGSFWSLQSGG
jgi:hypothetical protein